MVLGTFVSTCTGVTGDQAFQYSAFRMPLSRQMLKQSSLSDQKRKVVPTVLVQNCESEPEHKQTL